MEETRSSDWVWITARAESVLSGDPEHWEELWSILSPVLESWIARLPFFAHTGDKADHTHDVLVEVWEALGQDDHCRLRRFFSSDKARALCQTQGERTRAEYFQAWLRLVVRRVAHDHLRRMPEYIRQRTSTRSGSAARGGREARSAQRWRVIEQMTTGKAAITDGAARKALAHEMLQLLDHEVSPDEQRALSLRRRSATTTTVTRALGSPRKPNAKKATKRGRDHQLYRPAMELWCAGYSNQEIAEELEISCAEHAHRIVKAAKAYLRRRFAASSASH